jgi:DNA-binding protein HU-beta
MVNKDALVQAVAEASGISKADADGALNATVDVITAAVAGGDKVVIPGLGTFEPRDRAAREGRNPQSGETIQIAATTVPGFKPATAFKNAVASK